MEIKVKDTKDGRFYQIGEETYVSVTTPLSILSTPFLSVWRAKIGTKAADFISAKAAAHGTRVHSWAEKICKGEDIEPPKKPELLVMLANLTSWVGENVKRVIFTEQVVWSPTILVAGRCDLLAEIKGLDGLTVVDWKTGRVKREHMLQLAVYRHLISESQGIPLEDIRHRLVVQIKDTVKEISPDPKNPAEDNNMEVDWEVYKALLQVFHYFRG